MQMSKQSCKLTQIKKLIPLTISLFLLSSFMAAFADGIDLTNPVPLNSKLGVVDINTGIEAGHLRDAGGYDEWFEANYVQANNLGLQWNRWAVEWTRAESTLGNINSNNFYLI